MWGERWGMWARQGFWGRGVPGLEGGILARTRNGGVGSCLVWGASELGRDWA